MTTAKLCSAKLQRSAKNPCLLDHATMCLLCHACISNKQTYVMSVSQAIKKCSCACSRETFFCQFLSYALSHETVLYNGLQLASLPIYCYCSILSEVGLTLCISRLSLSYAGTMWFIWNRFCVLILLFDSRLSKQS